MKYHTTKDGRRIKITDMTDGHLINTIKFIERRAKEGIEVVNDQPIQEGWLFPDMDELFGEDALDEMGYKYFVNEYKRRFKKDWIPQ